MNGATGDGQGSGSIGLIGRRAAEGDDSQAFPYVHLYPLLRSASVSIASIRRPGCVVMAIEYQLTFAAGVEPSTLAVWLLAGVRGHGQAYDPSRVRPVGNDRRRATMTTAGWRWASHRASRSTSDRTNSPFGAMIARLVDTVARLLREVPVDAALASDSSAYRVSFFTGAPYGYFDEPSRRRSLGCMVSRRTRSASPRSSPPLVRRRRMGSGRCAWQANA
jgi:hypothetical protein